MNLSGEQLARMPGEVARCEGETKEFPEGTLAHPKAVAELPLDRYFTSCTCLKGHSRYLGRNG